ncbi:putative sugar kinase [uncultured archaeon]|nr:putative sugar kinase [uncultured archaeon]
MDLFAVGTPVVDLFAKADGRLLARLGLKKGASNYFDGAGIAAIEKRLGKRAFYRYAGDNARNVCEGFAALGGFCGYQGAVGADSSGAYFASNLVECKVAGFLQEKKGSTGKILALVTPDKERTFCVDLGVSPACSKEEKIAVKNARMLYVASITFVGDAPVARLCLRYMEGFKKAGKPVAISLESPPMVGKNRKFLLSVVKKYADMLFLNESEAEALLGGEAEKKLLRLKRGIPIYLKKGKHGSLLFHSGKAHRIPAMKARIVDTTGAGDAYAAGVLYGISRGCGYPAAGKIGCYLATKVAGKFGAGVPFARVRAEGTLR